MDQPKPPKQFSPDVWHGIPAAEKARWLEGYAAGLNAAIEHVKPEGIESLTKEIVAAEEAALRHREGSATTS